MVSLKGAKGENMLVIAGEPSGDVHAAAVVREIQRRQPQLSFWGVGGEQLAACGQEQLFTTKEMAIIGFTEVVKHLPFILHTMKILEREARSRRPRCAILVDYPGYNLRFAGRLRRLQLPILYYIAPQVWAWGAGRIEKMARLVDHLAVVFPFEERLFRDGGVHTTFVGHPLAEGLVPEMERSAFLQAAEIDSGRKILGLLPGSRTQEIRRLLPDMLRTAEHVRRGIGPIEVVIAQSANLPTSLYDSIMQEFAPLRAKLLCGQAHAVMTHSDVCVVASGTATLETAWFQTPFIVVYRVSPLSYQIGKRLIRVKHIGMVNIVAERQIVPEFIQHGFRPAAAAEALLRLLQHESEYQRMRADLAALRDRLGKPGAAGRVAELAMALP